VLLNLLVAELKHLEPVGEGALRGFCICKVVDDLRIWVGLLDVVIVEVDDGVAVGECLSPDPVAEDYLFFAVHVRALYLAVVTHHLLLDRRVLGVGAAVVALVHLHFEVFLVFFACRLVVRIRELILVLLQAALVVDFRNLVDRLFFYVLHHLFNVFFIRLKFFKGILPDHWWLLFVESALFQKPTADARRCERVPLLE